MVVYGGRLPPARRLVVSGLTASAIGKECRPGSAYPACVNLAMRAPHTGCTNLTRPPGRHTVALAALGGNLFGVTSWLLGLDGGRLAESSRLDVLVPVGGFRRCLDAQNGARPLALPLRRCATGSVT